MAEEVVEIDYKKMIQDELKAEGIEVAEEAAFAAMKAIMRVAPKIAKLTPNKIDDALVPALPLLEPVFSKLVDDINPADNAAE